MLNTKPAGPTVRVIVFYGGSLVFELNGTDDDQKLRGMAGPELAAAVLSTIAAENQPKVRAVKASTA